MWLHAYERKFHQAFAFERLLRASRFASMQGARSFIFIEHGNRSWVLDTKWKRVNAVDRDNKYGLSQGDFYQLFAYGRKYMKGAGEMALIYPRTAQFAQPLPPFSFDDELRLHVLPFDLQADALVGASVLSFFSTCIDGQASPAARILASSESA